MPDFSGHSIASDGDGYDWATVVVLNSGFIFIDEG
jgi:hypothetical protein